MIPEYKTGVMTRRDGRWFVCDEGDQALAHVPSEKLEELDADVEEGTIVEYKRRNVAQRGTSFQVRTLRLKDAIVLLPNPAGGPPPAGFVNPYNFVPLMGSVDRTQPESHERFRGYSGTLYCTLRTLTPFFTPDAERTSRNDEDHETLRLLRDWHGRGLIPGSAIKGMVRSLAEALSNSCLSVIDLDAHFSWRNLNNAAWRHHWDNRKVGVVESMPDGETPGLIAPARAARIYFEDLPEDAHNGDDAAATGLEEDPSSWSLMRATGVTTGPDGSGEKGIYLITEVPENGTKKSQRFIYDIKRDPERFIEFSDQIARDYNQVTQAGRDRDHRRRRRFFHGSDFTNADSHDHSRGKRQKRHRLREEDIIYYVAGANGVVRAGPVEASRVLYRHGVRDGVPDQFRPCHDPKKLCPCCRLFGWIPPARRERERADEESRAGFVSFSPALTEHSLTTADIEMASATLRPLGQPHASATNFYLQQPGDPTTMADYEARAFEVRGRKFYWHGEGGRGSYIDARGDGGAPRPDNQNKTVELLKAERDFHCSVTFENLTAAQLGLLLVAVQPSLLGAHHFRHKLGLGKPLGLGSVATHITGSVVVRREKRCRSLWATGVEQIASIRMWARDFVDAFIRDYHNGQGSAVSGGPATDRQAFARLPQIEPLLWMLDRKRRPQGVRYPPGPAAQEEESFRWFLKFKNSPKGRLLTPGEIIGRNDRPARQPAYDEAP